MVSASARDAVPDTSVVEKARRQASEAAMQAGVEVRLVNDMPDLEAVEDLVNRTWDNPTSEISVGVLRAFSKSGNFVSGAFHGDQLIGACVAFVGGFDGAALHSHLAAVCPHHRAKGVGFALKLHQRAWALDRGFTSVSWTFDPLVRRNARLNLARLGAVPIEFLPDFYGIRADSLNANLPTDRILVVWDLVAPRTDLACGRRVTPPEAAALEATGGRVLVAPGPGDEPVLAADLGEPIVMIGLPEDINDLRRDRPEIAEQWRVVVRDSLGRALDDGLPVIGFTEQGHYVIDRAGIGARPVTGSGP